MDEWADGIGEDDRPSGFQLSTWSSELAPLNVGLFRSPDFLGDTAIASPSSLSTQLAPTAATKRCLAVR